MADLSQIGSSMTESMVRKLESGEAPTPIHPKGKGEVTSDEFASYPIYYLYGEGREAADSSFCEHEINITSSCPVC